jgi:hypothetical protein
MNTRATRFGSTSRIASFVRRFALLFAASGTIAVACSDGTGGGPRVRGLRFVLQPDAVVAGQPFNVTVELLDADGEVIPNARNTVTLTTSSGAPVTGVNSVAAVEGLATFNGVIVTQAGTNAQLVASVGNTTTTSTSFAVAPAGVSSETSTMSVSAQPVLNVPVTLTFTFKDAFGNALADVPVMLSTNLGAATFTPQSGNTTTAGTFQTSFRAITPGTAAFSATVGGTIVEFETTLDIADPCPPAAATFPGNAPGTIPAGVCTIEDLPSASHRFTVAAENVFRFTLTAPFSPVLQISANPPIDNVALAGPSPLSGSWLLPAGTYQARISAMTGTGAYTLAGIVVPNSGCGVRLLAVGGTYTSQAIAADDCPEDLGFGDDTRVDLFVIFSERPCTITMSSMSVGGGPRIDPYLVTSDLVTGDIVAEDDDAAGDFNATVNLTACRSPSGPLRIAANHLPADGGFSGTGPYTLTIQFGSLPGGAAAGPSATMHADTHASRTGARTRLSK